MTTQEIREKLSANPVYYDLILGSQFYLFRHENSINLVGAAQKSGLSKDKIQCFEDGEGGVTFEEICHLLSVFDIDLEDFVDNAEKRVPDLITN